jgi:putative PEP-CTERM system TPR-repeat lipoprotein
MNTRITGFGFRMNRATLVAVLLAAFALHGCGAPNPEKKIASAKVHQAKGDLATAILELKSSLQENPEHGESRLLLGNLYSETGDYRSAEKEFRRAMDARVEPGRVLPALGKALVLQGEPKRVLAEISAETIEEPDAAAGILAARGLAHLTLRQAGEAQAAFEKALSLKPEHQDARLGRARLLAGEGKMEEALKEVDRALSIAPKAAEAQMLKGDMLRASGRVDEAVVAYREVVANQSGHVNGLLALVSLSVAAGKFDDAAGYIGSVRKTAPGHAMASYFQALIDFRKGEFKAARDSIGSVLKVAPNHLPSVLLGGAVEFALGSQELAQSRLKYVLDRAPSNAYARRLLIASYARAGQTHKAMELLEPILKQGSKDPAILALAGEVHMQLNEFDKAQKFFEKAAALAPQNSTMRTGLGLSRLAAGDVELATADLQSASALDTSKHHADVLLISTHLQRRQYAQALKAAQSLESKQPKNPLTHNLLAAAYIGSKDIPAARRSLEKALSLQPGYTPAAMNLAQLDLQEANKVAARKRFEDMIAKDRSNVQAYIALASLGSRIDATAKETELWLETARREGPGTIQPLVMLARFHFQKGNPKKALEVIDKAMAGAPDNAELLELAGQVQLAAGEKNRALGTFAKWVSAQPNSPQAHFRFATAQLANSDAAGAVSSLQKAIQHNPRFPEAQVLLAETQLRIGHHEEALKIADVIQKQDPKSSLGWVVQGDALLVAKRYGLAAKAYQDAFERGKSGTTAVKLHAALVSDGQAGEGEARLKDWIRSQPADLASQLYLAESYLKSDRDQDAIALYERVMAVSSTNVVVLNNLAWCYHRVQDKRAVETAERALKLKPENPAVIDTLGWILVQNGDTLRGLPLLRKAAGLAAKSADIRYHYAYALAANGEKPKAREELERLLLDFPSFASNSDATALLTSLRNK